MSGWHTRGSEGCLNIQLEEREVKIRTMQVNCWACGSCGKQRNGYEWLRFCRQVELFLITGKLFTCLSRVNTVATLSETGC